MPRGTQSLQPSLTCDHSSSPRITKGTEPPPQLRAFYIQSHKQGHPCRERRSLPDSSIQPCWNPVRARRMACICPASSTPTSRAQNQPPPWRLMNE